jgi:hypothetical protein
MRFVRLLNTTLEPFAGGTRQRVRSVRAELDTQLAGITTARDNTVMPIALIEGGIADDRPNHCDRGHLIALEFGGREHSENLVPMYGGFNSGGVWRTFEQTHLPSYAALKNGQGVRLIEVEIACTYSAVATDDPRIPTAFTVTARATGAAAAERTWPIPHPRPVPLIVGADPVKKAEFLAARLEMNTAGWLIEEQLGDMSLWPSYRRPPVFTPVANRNASDVERPYGFLDYMIWKSVKDTPSTLTTWRDRMILSATSEFSAEQIQLINATNRVLHDGSLMSDDPADVAYTQLRYRVVGWPPGTLVPGSRDLAPEVDHVIPRSNSGASAFSNAQVLSGKHNNTKRAQLLAQQAAALVNVQRGVNRSLTPTLDANRLSKARELLLAAMRKGMDPGQYWVLDYELRNESAWYEREYVSALAREHNVYDARSVGRVVAIMATRIKRVLRIA